MPRFHYNIVPHDGGWAYALDGAFSEPFASRAAAIAAVQRVVAEQHTPGDTTVIEYETVDGVWHTETSEGSDRPDVGVAS